MKTEEIISEGILKLVNTMDIERFSKEVKKKKGEEVYFVNVSVALNVNKIFAKERLHHWLKIIFRDSKLCFEVVSNTYGCYTLIFKKI